MYFYNNELGPNTTIFATNSSSQRETHTRTHENKQTKKYEKNTFANRIVHTLNTTGHEEEESERKRIRKEQQQQWKKN